MSGSAANTNAKGPHQQTQARSSRVPVYPRLTYPPPTLQRGQKLAMQILLAAAAGRSVCWLIQAEPCSGCTQTCNPDACISLTSQHNTTHHTTPHCTEQQEENRKEPPQWSTGSAHHQLVQTALLLTNTNTINKTTLHNCLQHGTAIAQLTTTTHMPLTLSTTKHNKSTMQLSSLLTHTRC